MCGDEPGGTSVVTVPRPATISDTIAATGWVVAAKSGALTVVAGEAHRDRAATAMAGARLLAASGAPTADGHESRRRADQQDPLGDSRAGHHRLAHLHHG